MNFQHELKQDFQFLLALCKRPEAAFDPCTEEYELTKAWLDKLVRYQCDNLNQLRLRNVYMSYLCACLNEGELSGPFIKQPNFGKLDEVDFSKRCCPQRRPDPCAAWSCNVCPQPVQPSGSTSCPRTSTCPRSSSRMSCPAPVDCDPCGRARSVYYMSQKVNYPDCVQNYMDMLPQMKLPQQVECQPLCCNTVPVPAPYSDFRADVAELLNAIAGELRGDFEPGMNNYLEGELLRYKSFMMNHSNLACILEKLQSNAKLRSFLLLHLQNDLVKLLNDKCL